MLIGIAIGVGSSMLLTRLIEHLLYDVSPLDGRVFAGTALTFATVGLLALLVPCLRILKLNPQSLLHQG